MPTFYVKLTAEIPCPREFEYREEGYSIGTAVNRAIKSLRKDLKGKKIIDLSIRVRRM